MDSAVTGNQNRRTVPLSHEQHWQAMTAEQKLTLYRLQPWGYRLLFVRNQASAPLAIIAQDQTLATLSADGILDTEPGIVLRH
ncbi:hypothetical protein [Shewanella cyperi]|uniref:hypothetical protein n=1 Tax=Shewanella cyperi TaxID=2814292 RepID=UPI001A93EAC4|nr:hypothetical protein [Shewanella cyperi]QSX41200.1 hypothetical protein JYB84_01855 [Shewanella cyperi]